MTLSAMSKTDRMILQIARIHEFPLETKRMLPNKQTSSLLRLPGELRNMILHHHFSSCTVYMEPRTQKGYPLTSDIAAMIKNNKSVLAIQLTCLQLHRETLYLAPARANIVAPTALTALSVPRIMHCALPLITKLTIQITGSTEVYILLPDAAVKNMLVESSGVRELGLEVWAGKIIGQFPALREMVVECGMCGMGKFEGLRVGQRVVVGKVLVETREFAGVEAE